MKRFEFLYLAILATMGCLGLTDSFPGGHRPYFSKCVICWMPPTSVAAPDNTLVEPEEGSSTSPFQVEARMVKTEQKQLGELKPDWLLTDFPLGNQGGTSKRPR